MTRALRWLGRWIVDRIHGDSSLGVLIAVMCASVVVSGCGGSRPAVSGEDAAGTSIAAAVIAFVAPRDGADAVIGAQLGSFAQTVETKTLDDCMTSDGFAAPTFPMIGAGPPANLGTPQFPNLPAIEATHTLGLFTGPVSFVDPQSGMSGPERQAWQARMGHCFGTLQQQAPLFGSAKFSQLNSSWFNVVNQVSGSARVRALSKRAARCSAAHGVPATSVTSLYGRLQNQIAQIPPSSANSAKVQAVQAKGASVLATCWSRVIDETTALLSARRAAFLAQNANAIAALQRQIDGQVVALGHRYGIGLTLVAS